MAKRPKNRPRPRWENLVSEIAACFWRDHLVKVLVEQHELSPDDSEYLKGAANSLSWMIPAIAVNGHSLAMMVANIRI